MAMKWISICVVALLGSLCDGQYYQNQNPQPQPGQTSPQIIKPPPEPTQKLVVPEPVQSCEVADNYKIQCGLPGTSATDCEAINCCFDGRMCYYGKAVTLQCTKDAQFIVVVARDATLPHLDLESVSLLGEGDGCGPVGITSAFAIYQFPVTSCGSLVMESSGVLTYENRMMASYEVAVGDRGAITRDSQYELLVQCRYIGTTVEALVIEVKGLPDLVPVAAPGPLRVELRLANGQCQAKGCVEEDVVYSSFYEATDYPVVKVLREPVYVEVRMMERTDPNLVLTLGRCWATSDSNRLSLPQWDLLIDGCPYQEDRYLTTLVPVDASSGLFFPRHHRRFIFKMFTFVGAEPGNSKGKSPVVMPLREKVYIHCSTVVCQPSSTNSCEPRCTRRRRDIGGAERMTNTHEATVVSSGGIIIRGST